MTTDVVQVIQPSITVPGVAQEDTLQSIDTTLSSTDFATETTLVKLKKWPYSNWDSNVESWNAGTFTETQTFRTGGVSGTIVGTITTVYTDATKSTRVSTVYSPQKVV